MSHRRLISVAVGAMSAMAFIVPAAQAQEDDTFAVASCVLVPGEVSGNTAVQSVPADQPWLFDTEAGTFDFAGPAICGGADVGASTPATFPSVVAGEYDITAEGTFVNWICGTGTANGDATIVNDPLNPFDAYVETEFGITFVAGVGTLSIVVRNENEETAPQFVTDTNAVRNDVEGGNGGGIIDILPSGSPNPIGDPFDNSCDEAVPSSDPAGVESFLVNGAFETSLSGDASN